MGNIEKENILKKFLDKNTLSDEEAEKTVFINDRGGLVERVDKTMITKDGRQLLID